MRCELWKTNWPQMDTDKRGLKTTALPVSIRVNPWLNTFAQPPGRMRSACSADIRSVPARLEEVFCLESLADESSGKIGFVFSRHLRTHRSPKLGSFLPVLNHADDPPCRTAVGYFRYLFAARREADPWSAQDALVPPAKARPGGIRGPKAHPRGVRPAWAHVARC